jgi:hypothetical protein
MCACVCVYSLSESEFQETPYTEIGWFVFLKFFIIIACVYVCVRVWGCVCGAGFEPGASRMLGKCWTLSSAQISLFISTHFYFTAWGLFFIPNWQVVIAYYWRITGTSIP